MISSSQVERLQDHLDRFTTMLIVGCQLLFVGGALGVFASQEFSSGTDFMIRLCGAEQTLGLLLIVVGWVKVRSIKAELNAHAPVPAMQAGAAAAGH